MAAVFSTFAFFVSAIILLSREVKKKDRKKDK